MDLKEKRDPNSVSRFFPRLKVILAILLVKHLQIEIQLAINRMRKKKNPNLLNQHKMCFNLQNSMKKYRVTITMRIRMLLVKSMIKNKMDC